LRLRHQTDVRRQSFRLWDGPIFKVLSVLGG
jgi:hypothetical protein